jgi:acetate kinase
MKILVINCGSSSIKYKLFRSEGDQAPSVIAEGIVERIGEPRGSVTHVAFPGGANRRKLCRDMIVADHGRGLEIAVELLNEPSCPVIADRNDIQAVGHRVVHGGEFFHAPTRIDGDTLAKIEAVAPLAPLHNPANPQTTTSAMACVVTAFMARRTSTSPDRPATCWARRLSKSISFPCTWAAELRCAPSAAGAA